MSYIYGAPSKARNANVVYIYHSFQFSTFYTRIVLKIKSCYVYIQEDYELRNIYIQDYSYVAPGVPTPAVQ